MNYEQIKAILTNALMRGDMQTVSAILAQLGIDPNIALTYMNAITPGIQGEVPANNLFDLLGATSKASQPQPSPPSSPQQQPSQRATFPYVSENLAWQPGQTSNTKTTTNRKGDLISLLGL